MMERKAEPMGVDPRRQERGVEFAQRAQQRLSAAEAVATRSRRISTLRAVTIIAALIFAAAAAWGDSSQGFAWVSGGLFVAFLALVIVHGRVLAEEDRAWRLWRVAENARLRQDGKWRQFEEDGSEFAEPRHPYSGDLDLFGKGSVFQFLSVAHTRQGQLQLAKWLTEPGGFEQIASRQHCVRELVEALPFRQALEANTLSSPEVPGEPKRKVAPLDLMNLVTWAESPPSSKPSLPLRVAAWVLPAITVSAMVAAAWDALPPMAWQIPFTVQILLSANYAARGARTFGAVASSPGVLSRLRPTLELIEQQPFDAKALKTLQAELHVGQSTASSQLRQVERIVSWFELRRNGMVYPIINALLLWDIHCLLALGSWQRRCGSQVRGWLSTLGQWEALSSLSGVGYDNPELNFPEVCQQGAVFEAVQLGHPLIDADKRVGNDVEFSEAATALLVTGSNMSGKSTLLRSLGLALVFGQAGAPVSARRLRFTPVALCTSMRISDSLSEGVSHFYAELKKLQTALTMADGAVPVFFLLDEILHGTNSEERQIGARWVLAELLRKGATGAVSTHDLGLCELPSHLMTRVRTVHLRETVAEGKMSFDYELREGPVQGGNALQLMRSIGLEVPVSAQAAEATSSALAPHA